MGFVLKSQTSQRIRELEVCGKLGLISEQKCAVEVSQPELGWLFCNKADAPAQQDQDPG